jgi:hypothetical protein
LNQSGSLPGRAAMQLYLTSPLVEEAHAPKGPKPAIAQIAPAFPFTKWLLVSR